MLKGNKTTLKHLSINKLNNPSQQRPHVEIIPLLITLQRKAPFDLH